jgi:membrane protein required for colicin V production
MNWFDLALAGVVLVSVITGMAKGFGRSAVGFLAFCLAIGCGLWFYGPFGFWLRAYIHPPATANGVGFVLVFAAVMILGGWAEHHTARFIRQADLKWLDRVLGGCFGIVQGAVSATVMVLCVMAFAPKPLPEMVMQSRYAPHLMDAASVIARSAPDEVKEGFERARRDLDKMLPEKLKEGVDKLSSSTL